MVEYHTLIHAGGADPTSMSGTHKDMVRINATLERLVAILLECDGVSQGLCAKALASVCSENSMMDITSYMSAVPHLIFG